MSYIGLKQINIPKNLTLTISENVCKVLNNEGFEQSIIIPKNFELIFNEDQTKIFCKPLFSKNIKLSKEQKSLWGTFRQEFYKIILGSHKKFTETLKLVGIGYKAEIIDKNYLTLSLGFSHKVNIKIPKNITINCPKKDKILIQGHNYKQIRQYIADIQKYKLPEPYKGKGIIKPGQYIRRKIGKV